MQAKLKLKLTNQEARSFLNGDGLTPPAPKRGMISSMIENKLTKQTKYQKGKGPDGR